MVCFTVFALKLLYKQQQLMIGEIMSQVLFKCSTHGRPWASSLKWVKTAVKLTSKVPACGPVGKHIHINTTKPGLSCSEWLLHCVYYVAYIARNSVTVYPKTYKSQTCAMHIIVHLGEIQTTKRSHPQTASMNLINTEFLRVIRACMCHHFTDPLLQYRADGYSHNYIYIIRVNFGCRWFN